MKHTGLIKLLSISVLSMLCMLSNTAFAQSECSLTWDGDLTGSEPTIQTEITQQAALEAVAHIGHYCNDSNSAVWDEQRECYDFSCSIYPLGNSDGSVFLDGTWDQIVENTGNPAGQWYSGTWEVSCEPVMITLSCLQTSPLSRAVVIFWTTEAEIENAGFNIYRAEGGEEYERINDALIPAEGGITGGASYTFTDDKVQNRSTYSYILEDIDTKGIGTVHGPVSATPRLIYGIGR